MFEFLTQSDTDAIAVIKSDHEKVKGLFEDFEKAETTREKTRIASEVIMELKIHTAIEEEILYPAGRTRIEKKIMNEADEEHHVAKLLVAELEVMDGTESHYDAKFKVLSENVRHHIKEEESDMLPKMRALEIDLEALGQKLLLRKEQLKKSGVATFAEEKMVKAIRNRGDSPAKNAKIKPKKATSPVAKKTRAKLAKPLKKAAKRPVAKLVKPAIKKSAKVLKKIKPTTNHKVLSKSKRRGAR